MWSGLEIPPISAAVSDLGCRVGLEITPISAAVSDLGCGVGLEIPPISAAVSDLGCGVVSEIFTNFANNKLLKYTNIQSKIA